jgi:hypothetical protein
MLNAWLTILIPIWWFQFIPVHSKNIHQNSENQDNLASNSFSCSNFFVLTSRSTRSSTMDLPHNLVNLTTHWIFPHIWIIISRDFVSIFSSIQISIEYIKDQDSLLIKTSLNSDQSHHQKSKPWLWGNSNERYLLRPFSIQTIESWWEIHFKNAKSWTQCGEYDRFVDLIQKIGWAVSQDRMGDLNVIIIIPRYESEIGFHFVSISIVGSFCDLSDSWCVWLKKIILSLRSTSPPSEMKSQWCKSYVMIIFKIQNSKINLILKSNIYDSLMKNGWLKASKFGRPFPQKRYFHFSSRFSSIVRNQTIFMVL